MSKFGLEDWVWYATTEHQEERVTCPDCAGTRFLTVIMGDGAQVTIDCSLCSVGYDPPRGFVVRGYYAPVVKHATVEGVERDREDGFKYRLHDCYSKPECDLFATREEAEARAVALAQELIQQEADKIKRREKGTRSWAWNARYHRECIRRAEKDLLYHRAKLEVANARQKDMRPPPASPSTAQSPDGQTEGGGLDVLASSEGLPTDTGAFLGGRD